MTGVVLAGRDTPVSKEELEKVQATVTKGVTREGLHGVIVSAEEAAAKGWQILLAMRRSTG